MSIAALSYEVHSHVFKCTWLLYRPFWSSSKLSMFFMEIGRKHNVYSYRWNLLDVIVYLLWCCSLVVDVLDIYVLLLIKRFFFIFLVDLSRISTLWRSALVKMPALRMKRIFDGDDFANEFNTRTVKSMKISHFHVSGLEQSAVLNSSDKASEDGK